jgi:hypothetical protein
VNVTTVTFNGISQPVNTTNISTITFGGTPQQVYQSTAGAYASTVTVVNTADNPLNVTGTISFTPPALTTVTFNGASQPVNTTNVSTVTISGTVPVSFSTPYAVYVSTVSAFINGSSNTVSAQQVDGTRWNVSFSTLQTTGVLSSTFNVTSVGISTPVAGVASQTVRVFRILVTVDATTTLNFSDGATNFGDQFPLLANGSVVLDLTNEPWYITSSSNGFVIKQSGSANISYSVWFTQS